MNRVLGVLSHTMCNVRWDDNFWRLCNLQFVSNLSRNRGEKKQNQIKSQVETDTESELEFESAKSETKTRKNMQFIYVGVFHEQQNMDFMKNIAST